MSGSPTFPYMEAALLMRLLLLIINISVIQAALLNLRCIR